MIDDNESLIEHEHICRICLENDSLDNLIFPCKCSGNSKYVHKKCLNEWRNINHNPESFYKCEICKYPYKIKKYISKCDEFCIYIKNIYITFLFLNLLISYFLSLFIIKYIDTKMKLCKYYKYHDCSTLYIFISGFIINLFLLIYILIYSFSIKNKKLYCNLFLKNIKNIFLVFVLIFLLFFLFDTLFCSFLLQFLILYILQVHINIIEKINIENRMTIQNYYSDELNNELELSELKEIELEDLDNNSE